MSIDDIKPTEAMKHYVGNDTMHDQHKSGYGGDKGKKALASAKRNVNDVTTFMDIPQDELTPAVTDAIISLMEELDDLREQISMSQNFEHMLSSSMDKHTDLPVLTRHALGREITLMCAFDHQSGGSSSFVYFQILNSSEIKARSGLLAFEAVIRESAGILKGQLRETDRIGTLGGDGFGVVLALTDPKQAIEKSKKLAELVQNGPLMHDGFVIDAKVAYGIHGLHENEEALSVLKAADKDLHRRFVET